MLAALTLAVCLASPPPAATAFDEPPLLRWGALLVNGQGPARVAPAVEALRGRRVRLVGFMVRMEEAPRGAVYLARRPVEADESGAGTADLPPEVVRVELPHLAGREAAWVDGPVEAVGRLEVGRAEDADGRVSWLRIVSEPPGASSAAARVAELPPSPGRVHP